MFKFFRLIPTLIAYGVFIFGALSQGILIVILLHLFVWNKQKRTLAIRQCVKLSFKFFVWLCRVLGVFKVNFNNLDKLKNLNNKIIIANHPSLVDYVILTSCLPNNVSVMVKYKLTKSFMRFIIKALDYVHNEMDYSALKQNLSNNDNFLIFPEGTRTKDNTNYKFHRGFVHIALNQNLKIVPIHISCDVPGYLNSKFLDTNVPNTTPVFTIDVKDEIDPKDFQKEDTKESIVSRHLTKSLEEQYVKWNQAR